MEAHAVVDAHPVYEPIQDSHQEDGAMEEDQRDADDRLVLPGPRRCWEFIMAASNSVAQMSLDDKRRTYRAVRGRDGNDVLTQLCITVDEFCYYVWVANNVDTSKSRPSAKAKPRKAPSGHVDDASDAVSPSRQEEPTLS
ncbi:hypothetical protein ml_345 [Mollivirus sibericum]|uniref:hypothetical protein n=1 Tax=Mollivirus sibericum TaxID=1678078 RepID=UPI0006B2E1C1|nr:hypothetical protein ml_345 [Mollivirus sibericum]ALD62147.1 hypothetical protein ml_345 [Mollivirus sibericum]